MNKIAPQVAELAQAVQSATGDNVQLAYVDQGYTGEDPATQAASHGMCLEVVKHAQAKRGFVLLPRRWASLPPHGRSPFRSWLQLMFCLYGSYTGDLNPVWTAPMLGAHQAIHRMSAPPCQSESWRFVQRMVSIVTLPPALIGDRWAEENI